LESLILSQVESILLTSCHSQVYARVGAYSLSTERQFQLVAFAVLTTTEKTSISEIELFKKVDLSFL